MDFKCCVSRSGGLVQTDEHFFSRWLYFNQKMLRSCAEVFEVVLPKKLGVFLAPEGAGQKKHLKEIFQAEPLSRFI